MSYKLIFLLVFLQIGAVCAIGCNWLSWLSCFKDSSDDSREYMRNYDRCTDKCKTQHPNYKKNRKDKQNFNECLENCMRRWNNRDLKYNRRRKQH